MRMTQACLGILRHLIPNMKPHLYDAQFHVPQASVLKAVAVQVSLAQFAVSFLVNWHLFICYPALFSIPAGPECGLWVQMEQICSAQLAGKMGDLEESFVIHLEGAAGAGGGFNLSHLPSHMLSVI